jgi:hypothetical protein
MAKFDPIMVRETTAAQMIECDVVTFRDLVRLGYLPPPRNIGGNIMRWDVEALRSIARGDIQGLFDEGRVRRLVRGSD